MVKSEDCIHKYGTPSQANKWMVLWNIPEELKVGMIPKRIYCNSDLVEPLKLAFKSLINTGMVDELKTWDGCFNIRKMAGSNLMSLHSWGIAVDVNAAENGLGQPPKLSKEFVECFTKNGFDWGGNFTRQDGMHFQLSHI
jgi:hypothetical protein